MCAPIHSRPPARMRILSATRPASTWTWSIATTERSTMREKSSRAAAVVNRSMPCRTNMSDMGYSTETYTHGLALVVRFACEDDDVRIDVREVVSPPA